jgi:putative nucleotidyltransferase with HDIG domain
MNDPSQPELEPYQGRWVALAGAQVAGVGDTAEAALQQGRRNRPRERLALQFVEDETSPLLPLSPLMDRLRPILQRFDAPVYLVGGALRDALLGLPNKDLDFAVPEGGIRLAFQVGDALGKPAFPLDKTRDTGRVMLDSYNAIDFARFRGDTLEEDLIGRDFTINAMALPAAARRRDSLIDPLAGQADLAAGVIRLAHPDALKTDPVRTLRAVRQGTQLGLRLLPETESAIREAALALADSSLEQIRDELNLILVSPAIAQSMEWLLDMGLMQHTLPEIAALETVAQTEPHHQPVLAHTIRVLGWLSRLEALLFQSDLDDQLTAFPGYMQETPANIADALAPFTERLKEHLDRPVSGALSGWHLLRWGGLWHDAGKRETAETTSSGKIQFHGHDKVGAALAESRMRQLRLSSEAADHIGRIVGGHMRPLFLALDSARPGQGALSRRAIYRFFKDCGSAGLDICLLTLADHLATYDDGGPSRWQNGEQAGRQLLAVVLRLFRTYFEDYQAQISPEPLLDGSQLMQALGLAPGPEIGRLLDLIQEAQAAGEVATADEALALARGSMKN